MFATSPSFRVRQFWQSNCAAGQCFWSGAIKIESLNGKKITAAVTNHSTQYAVAYSAVASGATRSYVSSVERRCADCAWNPGAGATRQLGRLLYRNCAVSLGHSL